MPLIFFVAKAHQTAQVTTMQTDQSIVPNINARELKEFIEDLLPQAQVTLSPINPDYGSWQIEVVAQGVSVEYLWGLCQVLDLNEKLGENDSPFDPYGVNLQSMEAAKNSLRTLIAR